MQYSFFLESCKIRGQLQDQTGNIYSRFSIFSIVSIELRLKIKGDSGYFVPLH